MPQLTFFIGKGGVGKTTVSAAYACHLAARSRKKILLLSTDPAHSLADIFEIPLSNRVHRVETDGLLFARQIDASAQVRRFLENQREGILEVMEQGSLFTRAELESLLDITLPGMAEVAALVVINELLESDYDEVVLDTAPMGHTLRLFEMPEHFARFLRVLEAASSRDELLARRFAGRSHPRSAFVIAWTKMVERVKFAFSNRAATLALVTTPEKFAINESLRAAEWLERSQSELRVSTVVVNRGVTDGGSCLRCSAQARATSTAVRKLRRAFEVAEILVGDDPGGPILGVPHLRAFGRHVFGGNRLRITPRMDRETKALEFKATPWPTIETPLSLTVGKGGVGKTTISAGLAVNLRRASPGDSVTICSSDPAPSLDDVFGCEVVGEPLPVAGDPGIRAAEFDAAAAYARWAKEMQERIDAAFRTSAGGVHIDLSFERELFGAVLDVVPPGVDEVYATLRIHQLNGVSARVVLDMAPTGHALELLRTPERMLACSRVLLKTLSAQRTLPLAQDAAVEIASISQQVRALGKALRNPKQCSAYVVMLAEPLPDRETARLLKSLGEVVGSVSGIFVNRILMNVDGRCRRCCRAQQWQLATLSRIRKSYRGVELYCVPEWPREVTGVRALGAFTRELLQVR